MQTPLRLFEGCGDSVPLGADTRELFALVSFAVTSLLGFVFPWMATVGDFGELTLEDNNWASLAKIPFHTASENLPKIQFEEFVYSEWRDTFMESTNNKHEKRALEIDSDSLFHEIYTDRFIREHALHTLIDFEHLQDAPSLGKTPHS